MFTVITFVIESSRIVAAVATVLGRAFQAF
jgi:hypothetical protein